MSDIPESQSARENPDTTAPGNTSNPPEAENPQPPATEAPATEAPATEAADIAPPLDGLIASIRAAVARGASPDQRTAGATACRSILTVLEAKPGQPLTPAQPPASLASATSPIAALLKQPGVLAKLAGMSRDQLIDLVKQTVAAMAKSPQAAEPTGPRLHLIQIPQMRPEGGNR